MEPVQGLGFANFLSQSDSVGRFVLFLLLVAGLPTAFLLGRDGRLVTTDVRGDKLEVVLERLLGVP